VRVAAVHRHVAVVAAPAIGGVLAVSGGLVTRPVPRTAHEAPAASLAERAAPAPDQLAYGDYTPTLSMNVRGGLTSIGNTLVTWRAKGPVPGERLLPLSPGRRALVIVAVGVAGLGSTQANGAQRPVPFPAAGDLVNNTLVVRAAPTKRARVVRVLHEFRKDFRLQIVLAVRQVKRRHRAWVELSLPGRPNGGRGWVPRASVELNPAQRRIVVLRGARRLQVRRISNGKVLFQAPVAVGMPGAQTPLGRNYYVAARFVPRNAFFGSYALETSAYSRLSDWPGGGVVGIHGTDRPGLIGQAVSHGCIRMFNRDVDRLRRLAPLGTPIDILP
jgi:lipoprotein-anchoring transpeptidase ErfK/SrfK